MNTEYRNNNKIAGCESGSAFGRLNWIEISKWNTYHGSSNKTVIILKYLIKIQQRFNRCCLYCHSWLKWNKNSNILEHVRMNFANLLLYVCLWVVRSGGDAESKKWEQKCVLRFIGLFFYFVICWVCSKNWDASNTYWIFILMANSVSQPIVSNKNIAKM